MAETSVSSQADYRPPKLFELLGSFLKAPRSRTDFADIFSPVSEEKRKYIDGLFANAAIFLAFYVFWSLVLVVLKLKGKDVGCASGRAFDTEKADNESLGSTDSSDFVGESSGAGSGSKVASSNDGLDPLQWHDGQQRYGEETNNFYEHSQYEKYHDSQDERFSEDSSQRWRKANQRERRTRFCFIVFSFFILISGPCILVFSFSPLRDATHSSDDFLLAAHDTLDQVNASLKAIKHASEGAADIILSMPTDLNVLCPQKDRIESELGINLDHLLNSVGYKFSDLNAEVDYQCRRVSNAVEKVDDGLQVYEDSFNSVEKFLWIVPLLLLAVSLVAAIATFGVILAWNKKSSKQIQQVMSYLVLPMLIIVSIACCISATIASVGIMLSSDMCMAGPTKPGSPDETIQLILASNNISETTTAFKFINAYTNNCIGPNPNEDIEVLQKAVQENIDIIWKEISKVDSIGRSKLADQCGSESLEDLFAGARNLAKLLTATRRALDSASDSLECSRIYPIYTQLAHDMLCTDVASGTAIGFVLFLVLTISTMTLISLRASWLQNVQEEKVYHDEDEVAENMILDEHEDYLAYISRYKHEWQEYNGIDMSAAQSHGNSHNDENSELTLYFDEQSDGGAGTGGEGYSGSEEYSESSDNPEYIYDTPDEIFIVQSSSLLHQDIANIKDDDNQEEICIA